MAIDAATLGDPQVVAEAVAAWASQRFGAPVDSPVEVATASVLTGGMDNFVHLIRMEGAALPHEWQAELVVRVRPSADRSVDAANETAIQNWCVASGYPAARVLALLDGDWPIDRPAQVAERAPGAMMLEAMTSSPRRIPALLRLLAALHAQLHTLPTEGWPVPEARARTAPLKLGLVRDRAAKGHAEIGVALARVERALAAMAPAPEVVCHGDFHPLNVMVDAADSAIVIDWTDATLDDRHSDVARTHAILASAAVAGGSAIERVLLAVVGPILGFGYLRAYKRLLPVDRDRLRRWEAVHLINGWAQIASLGDPGLESASAGRTFPKWILRSLQRRLDRTLRRVNA
jgi:aminoglycoside phosphotransferase (APT) family kinase protein